MAITFGGLSSGLPVNDIIEGLMGIERQAVNNLQNRVNDVRREISIFDSVENEVTQLQTALEALTADSFLDEDLFNARKTTSGNEEIITATAKENSPIQTLQVEVKKLATATQAKSTANIGQAPSNATLLSDIPGKTFSSGEFTIYVGNQANTITVDAETNTLGDVLSQIEGLAGVTSASLDAEGQINIVSGSPLTFGGNGDTSNFLKLTQLDTATDSGGGNYQSNTLMSIVDDTVDVSSAAANLGTAVTAGSTFKVGNAEFDTTGKTLAEILEEVNNSAEAGVSATFNRTDNTLVLTSDDPGSLAITLEDTSGNFLEAMGLLSGTDTLSSQTLGTNAEVVINGDTYLSTSNTLDEVVTGFTGLSLSLQSAKEGEVVTIEVAQDSDRLTEAVNSFITEFNEVINGISSVTDSESGALGPDNRLNGFRSNLRSIVSGLFSGGTGQFTSLQNIGISTGAVGAGSGGTAPTNLVLDSTAFVDALTQDSAALKELMVGENGILRSLQSFVDNSLDIGDGTTQGLFQAQENSAQRRIDSLNDTIERTERRLERREALLRRQFQASESLIAQYQSQGQAVSGLSAQLAANNAGAASLGG
jgi:flagellar hook-associated protein 2